MPNIKHLYSRISLNRLITGVINRAINIFTQSTASPAPIQDKKHSFLSPLPTTRKKNIEGVDTTLPPSLVLLSRPSIT